jgi:hypothetical protein
MGLELRTGNNRRVHRRKAGAKTEGKMIEIETQVQTATKPLKDIGLAIVQASKNCSDATKPLIRDNPVEHALVTELGVNVAQWSSKLEKVPKGVTLEGSLALDEWLAGLPPNVSKTVTTVGQVALK